MPLKLQLDPQDVITKFKDANEYFALKQVMAKFEADLVDEACVYLSSLFGGTVTPARFEYNDRNKGLILTLLIQRKEVKLTMEPEDNQPENQNEQPATPATEERAETVPTPSTEAQPAEPPAAE